MEFFPKGVWTPHTPPPLLWSYGTHEAHLIFGHQKGEQQNFPPPLRFPLCSGYISPYIPPLNIIKIQSVSQSVSQSVIVEISSKHLQSQSVKARELIFWKKVDLFCITPHMSYVTCLIVVIYSLYFFFPSFEKLVKLGDWGSVINAAKPV